MRKLIAAAAVLAVSSLCAAEEVKFGDVNYFLKAGQFNLLADWSQNTNIYTINNKYIDRDYIIAGRAGYGLTDRLNFYVGVDYDFNSKVEDKTATPKPRSYSHNGFSNPLVSANYRLLTQNEWRYNLDFGAVAKVNVQDAEIGQHVGATSNDGNYANGRSSLELNSRIGRKWNEANEWQFAAGVLMYQSGEAYLQKATEEKLSLDSSFDVFVRGTYQYRPVNEFMMLLSAQATEVGSADYKNKTTGVSYSNESHLDFDFRFTAKYLITDNFIAKFNYGQARYSDYTRTATGAADQDIEKRRNIFWGLGVDFLF